MSDRIEQIDVEALELADPALIEKLAKAMQQRIDDYFMAAMTPQQRPPFSIEPKFRWDVS